MDFVDLLVYIRWWSKKINIFPSFPLNCVNATHFNKVTLIHQASRLVISPFTTTRSASAASMERSMRAKKLSGSGASALVKRAPSGHAAYGYFKMDQNGNFYRFLIYIYRFNMTSGDFRIAMYVYQKVHPRFNSGSHLGGDNFGRNILKGMFSCKISIQFHTDTMWIFILCLFHSVPSYIL